MRKLAVAARHLVRRGLLARRARHRRIARRPRHRRPLHHYAGFAPWHYPLLAALLFLPAVWAADVTARTLKN